MRTAHRPADGFPVHAAYDTTRRKQHMAGYHERAEETIVTTPRRWTESRRSSGRGKPSATHSRSAGPGRVSSLEQSVEIAVDKRDYPFVAVAPASANAAPSPP